MIQKVGLYHVNNLKNNFKHDSQKKWYDNDEIYTLENRSKRHKRYLKTGIFAAIILPIYGKYSYDSLSKSMNTAKAKRFLGLEMFAILFPGIIYLTLNEIANYLHNKNKNNTERK